MSDPILSREEVLELASDAFGIDYDRLDARFEKYASLIEAAVLEKVCGEPIYQVWIEETSSYADVTAEYYSERLPSNRRIVYALTRSKP